MTMATDAELRVLATNALRTVILERVPQFDPARGHPVSADFDSTNRILGRLFDGEAADLVIATDAAIDELVARGKVITGSRVDLASAGIGVCVRAGAHWPDVGSVADFRRALLDAKSIAYTLTGQSGVYFAGVIERLGIASDIKAKAVVSAGGLIGEVVARGEAELGVQQISEILAVPGVELAGPLPPELQLMTLFSAGICTGTRQAETARALIRLLATPDTARLMRTKGLEPVTRE
jgi:molybdate transport system substrate-binding protein